MAELTFQYRSLKDCVMDYLKQEMELGNLKPGERINEKEICQKLGVSRTPIREALIQLEKEGFIEISPRKSIRVKKLSLKEIEDIYQVIGALESEAAVIACDRMTSQDLAQMEKDYDQMVEALAKDDFKKYMDINLSLHNIHLKLCGNEVLVNIVNQLKKRLYDFPRIMLKIPEWEEKCIEEHRQLIKFFKEKNKEAIKDLIKNKHWGFENNRRFIQVYYNLLNSETKEESQID
ncbi:MAG: GntR family transcriptional regulator [Candidatus Aminicenantes bacterium]|nr:GntR family transcriptional regulator [Candidatus Aminicenantes bacterium]